MILIVILLADVWIVPIMLIIGILSLVWVCSFGCRRITTSWSKSDRGCVTGLRMIGWRRDTIRVYWIERVSVIFLLALGASSSSRLVRDLIVLVIESVLLSVELLSNTKASIFLISIHLYMFDNDYCDIFLKIII
jgi:hypothetical protein